MTHAVVRRNPRDLRWRAGCRGSVGTAAEGRSRTVVVTLPSLPAAQTPVVVPEEALSGYRACSTRELGSASPPGRVRSGRTELLRMVPEVAQPSGHLHEERFSV